MKKTDRAWLAGLVNGEGCISGMHSGTVQVQISMCDVWCLWRVVRLVSAGHLGPWTHRPNRIPFRRWGITGRNALKLVAEMRPWLSPVKLADFDYAMKLAPNAGRGPAWREKAKTHCPKGHPLSGKNLFRDSSGWRHCKVCRKRVGKAWYDKNKHTRFWVKYRSRRARS